MGCGSFNQCQIEKYKYNPNNLQGIDTMKTNGGSRVIIHGLPEWQDRMLERQSKLGDLSKTHLVIAGCTESGEEETMEMMGSGLIIGRYSIFYNGPSRYSGRSPQESGYSLDIPKDIKTVKTFLTNDSVLEAIASREQTRIKMALASLNSKLKQPILTTSYLAEALKVM